MEFLPLFVGYILVCLGCATIYALGDQPFMMTGLIGTIRQYAWKTCQYAIPKSLWNLGACIIKFLFCKRNHTFQAMYLLIKLSSHIVLVTDVIPYLYVFHPNQSHALIPFILFTIGTILYIVCCVSDPGEINHKTYAQYHHMYKYDGEMYTENKTCESCKLNKPARSKHCSTCDICIIKFDHHCVWTNSCIGGKNQRYFLAFLITLCTMVANGIYMACLVLHNITVYQNLWSAKYVDHTGVAQDMTHVLVVQHLFMQFPRIVFLVAAMSAIELLMVGFMFYHIYLAINNQTTNERYKRYYMSLKNYGKTTNEAVNPYDLGIAKNLMEVFSPMQPLNKLEKKNGFISKLEKKNGVILKSKVKHR